MGLTEFLCSQGLECMRPDYFANLEAFRLAYSIPEATAVTFVEHNKQILPSGFIPLRMPFADLTKDYIEQRFQALASPKKQWIIDALTFSSNEISERLGQPAGFVTTLSSLIQKNAEKILSCPDRTTGSEIDTDRLIRNIDKASELDIVSAHIVQAKRLWKTSIKELLDTKQVDMPLENKDVLPDWMQAVALDPFIPTLMQAATGCRKAGLH